MARRVELGVGQRHHFRKLGRERIHRAGGRPVQPSPPPTGRTSLGLGSAHTVHQRCYPGTSAGSPSPPQKGTSSASYAQRQVSAAAESRSEAQAVGSQLQTFVGRQGTDLTAAASTAGIGTSYWSPRRKPLMI